MKKMNMKELAPLGALEIIAAIGSGVEFISAHRNEIKAAFAKISEFLSNIKTRPGLRKRVEALEAQNALQKEMNKIFEGEIAGLKGGS